MNYRIVTTNELYHHGIRGQKWGVRRFQNPDGSLTAKGQKRYSSDDKILKKESKAYVKANKQNLKDQINKKLTEDETPSITRTGIRNTTLDVLRKNKDMPLDEAIKKAKNNYTKNLAIGLIAATATHVVSTFANQYLHDKELDDAWKHEKRLLERLSEQHKDQINNLHEWYANH